MAECLACSKHLSKPFIRCSQCTAQLCLHCFAVGWEKGDHKSDHCYEVIKDDFILFESSWTAEEEFRLLDAVAECGYANWTEVAERVRYKSAKECERHYEDCYLNYPVSSLPDMPSAELTYFPCPLPFRVSINPPRPSEDSSQQLEMSGYCSARSDFSVEHNNFAEMDIKEISFTDIENPLLTELQFTVLRVYRNILKERRHRKFIIRQFGLIDMGKHLAQSRHYERIIGSRGIEALRHLSRLFLSRPVTWDLCLEALSWEATLRQRIVELKQYREAGLQWLRPARIYDKLASSQKLGDHRLLDGVLHYIQESYQCQPWTQRKMVFEKLSKSIDIGHPAPPRRTAPPLDITGLPGCERLTQAEKQLCSRVRLVPESYLEFRRLLVTEYHKHGQLRLAQARVLLKIDVNKTRKIYDFLISEGLITSDRTKITLPKNSLV